MRSKASLLVVAWATLAGCSSSGSTTGGGGGSTSATGTNVTSTGTQATSTTATGATSTTATTSSGTPMMCPGTGAPVTALPACTSAPTTTVNVPSGCVPTVDGTFHTDEWSDAACFTLTKGDAAFVKYAEGNLYLAYVVPPMAGGAPFAFDPDGGTTFDGDEFIIGVFGDPFGSNGDEFGLSRMNGMWKNGVTPDPSIIVRCPPNQPNPPTYEWKIPLAKLGATPGQAHSFRFALVDAGSLWPAGLTLDGQNFPSDPSNWGVLSSSANWQ